MLRYTSWNVFAYGSLCIDVCLYFPKCEIQSNGDLLCDEKYTLEIKVKGEKPNDGHIIFNVGLSIVWILLIRTYENVSRIIETHLWRIVFTSLVVIAVNLETI